LAAEGTGRVARPIADGGDKNRKSETKLKADLVSPKGVTYWVKSAPKTEKPNIPGFEWGSLVRI
jgi:hypothetical protein